MGRYFRNLFFPWPKPRAHRDPIFYPKFPLPPSPSDHQTTTMAAQGNTSQASLPTAAANQLSMASPSPPIPIPFRFLDLTNEVKEIILRLVLVSEHPLEPTESEHNNFQFGVPVADLGHQGYQTADDGGMLDDHLALSLTCKTIYNASLRIYFGQNEFLLRSPWELERDECMATHSLALPHIC